jgi:hypothetical protein
MSRPGEGTGHIQTAAGSYPGLAHLLSWPMHYVVGVMDLSFTHAQAGGTKDRISILCLSFLFISYTCPIHLK